MPSRIRLFVLFQFLFASLICDAQTANCTNWKFFNLPASVAKSTFPMGINRWGTVVGYAQDATSCCKFFGFIRYSNGNTKTYLFPHTSLTLLSKRNALGVTVGSYAGAPDGLVLSGSSTATVDYPGASATMLQGINDQNTMVGIFTFTDFTFYYDGFQLKDGVFTTLHYPGSMTTSATSISDKGVIVGWYRNPIQRRNQGFLLANGVYKTLDNPKATSGDVDGTYLNDINSAGVIVGTYNSVVSHTTNISGFIYIKGTFKDIKVPKFAYSRVEGINDSGYVTGMAFDYSGSGSETGFTAHCQ